MTPQASKVLLVGAEGYIGSNCPFECDKIDIKSGEDFLEFLARPYDTIIFLASRLQPVASDYKYNEQLYNRLDAWLILFPDTHVIYSSSAAVYGEGQGQPHKENDYLRPINFYGESKLSGEYHVREYTKHTVLRFANVYGKMDGQEGHGATEMFQMGVKTIYGDGNQVRDFVPVSKIWQAIERAMDYPEYWQGVYNVSLMKPFTINQWYEKYGHGDPDHTVAREGDIFNSILDNSKMKAALARDERDRE